MLVELRSSKLDDAELLELVQEAIDGHPDGEDIEVVEVPANV